MWVHIVGESYTSYIYSLLTIVNRKMIAIYKVPLKIVFKKNTYDWKGDFFQLLVFHKLIVHVYKSHIIGR